MSKYSIPEYASIYCLAALLTGTSTAVGADDMAGAMRALYVWITGECYQWSELEEEWLLRSCEP